MTVFAILKLMIDLKPLYDIKNWNKVHKSKLTPGQRAADKLRNGMGSWTFVFVFCLFMAAWAVLNTVTGWRHWDEYTFILLNLFLSMLAGLQGAILLIASKRQDSVNAIMAQHDYDTNKAAERGVRKLISLHEEEIELLNKLHKRLDALEKQAEK